MRPMYETKQDLQNETDVMAIAEAKWKCKMIKLPIRYGLDYSIVSNDKVVAFCEIKVRNYTMAQINSFGGYILSVGKWSSAKQLYDCTGMPFILIVKTTDGVWYASFKDFKPDDVIMAGRKDRGDWQDFEPCVTINASHFTKLEA